MTAFAACSLHPAAPKSLSGCDLGAWVAMLCSSGCNRQQATGNSKAASQCDKFAGESFASCESQLATCYLRSQSSPLVGCFVRVCDTCRLCERTAGPTIRASERAGERARASSDSRSQIRRASSSLASEFACSLGRSVALVEC